MFCMNFIKNGMLIKSELNQDIEINSANRSNFIQTASENNVSDELILILNFY